MYTISYLLNPRKQQRYRRCIYFLSALAGVLRFGPGSAASGPLLARAASSCMHTSRLISVAATVQALWQPPTARSAQAHDTSIVQECLELL